MAKIHFYPANIIAQVAEGTTILEAALEAGVVIESPCNGEGTCGKCKVKLSQQSLTRVTQDGKHHLSAAEEEQGFVLSCQTVVHGDIDVEVVKFQHNDTLKIVSEGLSLDHSLERLITKVYDEKEDVTSVLAGDGLLGKEAGDTSSQSLGVVVDIGTTTLVASLVHLSSGQELGSASALNPQSLHAQDVLSRIKFASEAKGLDIMYSALIKEVNRLIGEVAEGAGISKEHIYEVVFSGNTCMLHLATKVNPATMGKYPYTPQITGGNHVGAAEHGLEIAQFGLIYLPPIVSSYVGADITSGILAARLKEQTGV
ncbi:MAG TPA: 2Fe-2S iron-sulfur cluster-binding protein, partial [Bacillota bacterium]|nr:2Fe-2S iron-sulfur cluster-binding protein [Bacillota bacterium]